MSKPTTSPPRPGCGRLGGWIGIGAGITEVQETFGKVFNEGTEFQRDGSQFDALLQDGDVFELGELAVRVIHTPGHTPACVTYVIGDAAFADDTLFMPDGGTARADFPGGDAGTLWDSIRKVLALPDETRLFICHDYGPGGRDVRWETTVAERKRGKVHVAGRRREEFVELREARDATLDMPRLILPSLQVNMQGGKLPAPEPDAKRLLKVPLDTM
jgi:glyoxylase-like metal-dependent hydrolase (beta-lactamase superfamily II)